jgi:hypothetical protein
MRSLHRHGRLEWGRDRQTEGLNEGQRGGEGEKEKMRHVQPFTGQRVYIDILQ